MKSPLTINLIAGFVLAAISYFLLPLIAPSLSANIAVAIGIIIGAVAASLTKPVNTEQSVNSESPNTQALTTLYVGNLPYRANEQAVKQHFQSFGEVSSVRLMKDKRTGKRKGYGFVEISSQDAQTAINKLNDSEFQDRTLKVRLAKEKSQE